MRKFAKLFESDTHGQILATIDTADPNDLIDEGCDESEPHSQITLMFDPGLAGVQLVTAVLTIQESSELDPLANAREALSALDQESAERTISKVLQHTTEAYQPETLH